MQNLCKSIWNSYLVEGSNVVAYRLKGHAGGDTWQEIIVVLNGRKEGVEITIPEAKYTVVCATGVINGQGISKVHGPRLFVAPQSATIIYR